MGWIQRAKSRGRRLVEARGHAAGGGERVELLVGVERAGEAAPRFAAAWDPAVGEWSRAGAGSSRHAAGKGRGQEEMSEWRVVW